MKKVGWVFCPAFLAVCACGCQQFLATPHELPISPERVRTLHVRAEPLYPPEDVHPVAFGHIRASDAEKNLVCVSTRDEKERWFLNEYDIAHDRWTLKNRPVPVDSWSNFFLLPGRIYFTLAYTAQIWRFSFPSLSPIGEIQLENPCTEKYLLVDTAGEHIFCFVGGFGAANLYRLSPDVKVEAHRSISVQSGSSLAADAQSVFYQTYMPPRRFRCDHNFVACEEVKDIALSRHCGAAACRNGWFFFDSYYHIYAYDA